MVGRDTAYTANFPLPPGALWVTYKHPMNYRRANKQQSREARSERKQLVHAAGCVIENCCSKWYLGSPEWASDPELTPSRRIAVPRSLRPILGSHIGGAS